MQYTRNPSGIGGALRKIGGMTPLKHITSEVGQCNHMFFSQAMKAVFASHPPIRERIARVEGIDTRGLVDLNPSHRGAVEQVAGATGFSSGVVRDSVLHSGCVGIEHLRQAKESLLKIDETIRSALQSGWSARLAMFALVAQNSTKSEQWVAKQLSVEELIEYRNISSVVKNMEPITRLPMIDLAAPALRSLSQEQLQAFHTTLLSIVKSDGVVDRFEWVLVSVLQKHTSNTLGDSKIKTRRFRLSSYESEIAIVLGTLAYCGTNNQEAAELAFLGAMKKLGVSGQMVPVSSCTMGLVNKALKKLRQLKFVDRGRFIEACELCVTQDNRVTVVEAETLRAIGDILDCPIPMFV